jgi:hypothetical protein
MNYADDLDFDYSDDDLYRSRNDKERPNGKRGRPKKENPGVPTKPGNWRSLGVRPKYDPVTNEPTSPSTLEERNRYTISPLPLQRFQSEPVESVARRKRVGRPAGSNNRSKKRYAVDPPENTDYEEAPIFSPSYRNQTEPHRERYTTPSNAGCSSHRSAYNILGDLQTTMEDVLIKIRNEVMEQCDWSISTYYRKQHTDAKLSNAEADMIGSLVRENIEILSSRVADLIGKIRPIKTPEGTA